MDIAPLAQFTTSFGWRYELKKGDLIDCLDTEAIWYRSTVMKTRDLTMSQNGEQIQVLNYRGDPIKQVFVAFRYYHDEGHKEDTEGGHFTGWTNKYDDWYNVSSPLIQRYDSVAKHYKVAGRAAM